MFSTSSISATSLSSISLSSAHLAQSVLLAHSTSSSHLMHSFIIHLSLVLVTEGLTLLLCLTASGLFSRTCLTARPAPSVVSDAKGHLTAVITIRHHIYFAHLFFPLLGYCHLSLIRIGYHMYPYLTRQFLEILVSFFSFFYACKIPHFANLASH